MNQQFDAIVVGGGVVGLTAALGMVLRGLSVALIDKTELVTDLSQIDPRVYAINQASQKLLERLGAWQHLPKGRLSPYRQIYVWDSSNSADIHFDARTVARERLGTIIEESVLKQALLDALKLEKQKLKMIYGTVDSIESREQSIEISTGKKSYQAKLLMIADGANSPCRQLLKVPMKSWSYHQQALVAQIKTEKAHQQTAYQVFNPEGALAFLPLPNTQQCSIVWSTTPAKAEQLSGLSEEEFNQQLAKAFAHKLGEVHLEGKRHLFPLTMRHVQHYVGSRWLLMGDAAHTIHPLAGLGLNVGLADVATWLDCMESEQPFSSLKKTLGAYQRQRKHAVWQIIMLMEGFKTLFTNKLTPVVALRGLGLQLCNKLTPIKRLFIEQASG